VLNVVLTGFMGTGKSTVGRLLAERLGYQFVDTDSLIEAQHGPIPEIFAEHGEGTFREIEREVAAELAESTGLVISTGGRMMVDAVNADVLGRSARVFCLTASVDTILSRVAPTGSVATRPMLAGPDVRQRIGALLAERAEAYALFEQIDTEHRTPSEVADQILGQLDIHLR
jgi:shikimate kinase